MTIEGVAAKTTEIGFCSKCHLIRQDDEHGPVTPCACFIEHHADDCHLRIAIQSPISVACVAHDRDSCPACFSCSCGVAADRMFVCSRRDGGHLVFSWEPEGWLMFPRREEAP